MTRLFKQDPVLLQRGRLKEALELWQATRNGVNDPDSVPPRLDGLIWILRRMIDPLRDDFISDAESLLVEFETLIFVEEADETLRTLEEKTLAVQGSLGNLRRATLKAGYAEDGEDIAGLPHGARIAPARIAEALESLENKITAMQDGIDKIDKAQKDDRANEPPPLQQPLVQNFVEKVNIKIEFSLIKLKGPLIDITGLVNAVQDTRQLVTAFLRDVSHLALNAGHWLKSKAESWIVPPAKALGKATSAMVAKVKTFFQNRAVKSDEAKAPPTPAEPATTPPADFDLALVHDIILRGEAPPAAWVPSITKLDFSSSGFQSDFEQRKRFRALSDLSPLAGLTALQGLDLTQTSVSDLSPLAGLTALQELWLNQTSVSDLSPLAGLTALQGLTLNQTSVSDLSPLAGLTALQGLWLTQTSVSDLAPLSGLTALSTLWLDQTSVSDLSPLRALPNLADVYAEHGRVGPLAATLGRKGVVKLFKPEDFGMPKPPRRRKPSVRKQPR
jgi:hypothetical protein